MSTIDFKGMPLKPETEFDVIVVGSKVILTNQSMAPEDPSPDASNESDA
jgi:hypothetical protein